MSISKSLIVYIWAIHIEPIDGEFVLLFDKRSTHSHYTFDPDTYTHTLRIDLRLHREKLFQIECHFVYKLEIEY